MNNISIAGNVAKDTEVRYLPNGDPIASFSVADNQGKDKQAIFWRCSLFGKRAESLGPYLTKGQAVTISGSVTEREYTDKDGQQKKAQEIRVNDLALQGGKREGAAPAQRQAPAPAPRQAGGSGFDDMDDEIPFNDPMKRRAFALSI